MYDSNHDSKNQIVTQSWTSLASEFFFFFFSSHHKHAISLFIGDHIVYAVLISFNDYDDYPKFKFWCICNSM